jgi:hypothetical protein
MLRRVPVDDTGYGRRKFSEDQEDDEPKLLHGYNAPKIFQVKKTMTGVTVNWQSLLFRADEPFAHCLPCLDQA